jgi:hypothetical protein
VNYWEPWYLGYENGVKRKPGVIGGSEDQPERWRALNHSIAVNKLLGFDNRVAMTNRKDHSLTPEAMEQVCLFFEHFLKEPNRQ